MYLLAMNLLKKMLEKNPNKRIHPWEALQEEYFYQKKLYFI